MDEIKRHPVTGEPVDPDICDRCGADDSTPHWVMCPLRLDRSSSVAIVNPNSAYFGTWGVVDRQIGTTVYVSFDAVPPKYEVTTLPFGRSEVAK